MVETNWKKEYIVEVIDTGKVFGKWHLNKIRLDDERLTGDYTVNCEMLISDKIDVKKRDKFKVTLERIE
jgi:hypothetical protein